MIEHDGGDGDDEEIDDHHRKPRRYSKALLENRTDDFCPSRRALELEDETKANADEKAADEDEEKEIVREQVLDCRRILEMKPTKSGHVAA